MSDINVIHNPDQSRFEVTFDDGSIAMITYRQNRDTIAYNHAETPPQHREQGIAGKIAHVAMEYAKENNLSVLANCPFVKHYVSEHPEYHSITQGY